MIEALILAAALTAAFAGGMMFGIAEGKREAEREMLARKFEEQWIGEPPPWNLPEPPKPSVVIRLSGKSFR
jgi:hypothetical protein